MAAYMDVICLDLSTYFLVLWLCGSAGPGGQAVAIYWSWRLGIIKQIVPQLYQGHLFSSMGHSWINGHGVKIRDIGCIYPWLLKLTPLIWRVFRQKERENGIFWICTYVNFALSGNPEPICAGIYYRIVRLVIWKLPGLARYISKFSNLLRATLANQEDACTWLYVWR